MLISVPQLRKAIVDEAACWLGTPYHAMGRVKGAGVDCLTLLAEVYVATGIIPPVEVPYYPQDWHLHRGRERYLDGLLNYTREIEVPLPGDIALWKFGRCYSHGAIVTEWPQVIHAYVGRACVLEDTSRATWLMNMVASENGKEKPRPLKFFSVF